MQCPDPSTDVPPWRAWSRALPDGSGGHLVLVPERGRPTVRRPARVVIAPVSPDGPREARAVEWVLRVLSEGAPPCEPILAVPGPSMSLGLRGDDAYAVLQRKLGTQWTFGPDLDTAWLTGAEVAAAGLPPGQEALLVLMVVDRLRSETIELAQHARAMADRGVSTAIFSLSHRRSGLARRIGEGGRGGVHETLRGLLNGPPQPAGPRSRLRIRGRPGVRLGEVDGHRSGAAAAGGDLVLRSPGPGPAVVVWQGLADPGFTIEVVSASPSTSGTSIPISVGGGAAAESEVIDQAIAEGWRERLETQAIRSLVGAKEPSIAAQRAALRWLTDAGVPHLGAPFVERLEWAWARGPVPWPRR